MLTTMPGASVIPVVATTHPNHPHPRVIKLTIMLTAYRTIDRNEMASQPDRPAGTVSALAG